MIHCRQCRRFFEFSSTETTATCPHCGQVNRPPAEENNLVSVARLANLAEVGYFDAILADHGIEALIRQQEDYDAIAGTWAHSFVIQVTAEVAQRAVSLIESELETSGGPGQAQDPTPPASEMDDTETATNWKPLALVLAVVAVVYGASRLAPALIGRPAASGQSLWNAVAESDRPMATNSAAGKPRRVLYFDRRTNRLLLDEDFNGDGRIDRRREFTADRLVQDSRP